MKSSLSLPNKTLPKDTQIMRLSIMSIFLFILLTGCSAPTYSIKPQFTPKTPVSSETGSVVFSTLDTSKWDVAYAFVFGTHPLPVSIYDITDDLKYIGTMHTSSSSFIEYTPPFGKRILMLTSNGLHAISPFYHTDFIEVDITKDKMTHIAISQSGLRQMPYFHELLMKDKDFDFCSQPNNESYISDDKMNTYMSENGIDPNAKYFKKYCNMLSSKYKSINVPNQHAYQEFESRKAKIQDLKNKDFPEWKKDHTTHEVFDLVKPILLADINQTDNK